MAEARIDPMSSSSSADAAGSDSAAGWSQIEIVSYPPQQAECLQWHTLQLKIIVNKRARTTAVHA